MNKLKNKEIIIILGILFLGLLLRLISLNQSFWLDETTSGFVAKDLSFSEILTKFAPGDFHSPLYYLFLKIWGSVFGFNEVSLRVPSVLAGVGTIYFVFLMAKRLFNNEVAILSSLLLTTSGLHIYYSQEARMYSISVFLVTASLYYFVKILNSRKTVDWAIFSLLITLNAAVDYLPNLILIVFVIAAYVLKKDKNWWKKFILVLLPIFMFWIFWMPTLATQLEIGLGVKESLGAWWGVLGRTSIRETSLFAVKLVIGRISFENSLVYAFAGVLSLIYWLLIVKSISKKSKDVRLVALWFIIPTAIAWVSGFWISVFSYFRLIFVLPAFYILVSIGTFSFKKNYKYIAIFLVLFNLATTAIYLFNTNFHREDWRGIWEQVRKRYDQKSAIILQGSGKEALNYYFPEANIINNDQISSYEQLFLLRYTQPIFDPDDNVKLIIENSGYKITEVIESRGVSIWKYNENSN